MKKIKYLFLVLLTSLCMAACGQEEPADQAQEIQTEETKEEPNAVPTEEPKAEPTVEPTKEAEPTATPEVAEEPTPEAEPTVEPTKEAEPTAEPTKEAEPATAVSLEASVSGNHSVGDTLQASDFTVTVNMSDGSKVKNPGGWSADKLTLDSESTIITVSYNNLSTKVTVKAEVKQKVQQPAQEPQQPQQQKYPASAYQPISQQAKDDFYAYAMARGYVYKTDVSPEGHPYDYVEKDDVPDTDYVGINYTVGWCVMYARCDDADIMSKNNYTGTLEFLYIYIFG